MAIKKINIIVEDLPKGSGEYTKRDIAGIDRIMIHHSASPTTHDAYTFAAWHISESGKGWPGIGYHYVINRNGDIQQTNYLATRSYHSGSISNTKGIGVCLVGNFNMIEATEAQVKSAKWLIRYLNHELNRKLKVLGHFEVMDTSCPGSNFIKNDLSKLKTV
jgi:N-acetyl-anhydromuramyl-L-alanine amidase AmpD